jgi:hypothetical protein
MMMLVMLMKYSPKLIIGVWGGGGEKKPINSTLVTMCEKGVSGGGVNIKDPKPLYIMECEWGSEG